MKIKPQTLLRSFLAIPYIGWGISLLIVSIPAFSAETLDTMESPIVWVGRLAAVYAIGIMLWGIPYTLLAIGLLIWSFKKSARTIAKVFLLSPILLSILLATETALVTLPNNEIFTTTPGEFLSYAAMLAILALIFGYTLILIAFGVYKALGALHLIQAKTEAGPNMAPSIN